jgi:hypothetical protein
VTTTETTAQKDGEARVQRHSAQESVRDLAKLIISLASAVVVLSATFADKLSHGVGIAIVVLYMSWICLATSIVFGVKAISKLAHAQWTGADRWGEWTFPPMRRSWQAFQAGMGLLLGYAAIVSGIQARHGDEQSVPAVAVSCANCDCIPRSAAPLRKPTQSVP